MPVASGAGHEGTVTLHQEGAVMSVARLDPERSIVVPTAPYSHVFVARGTVGMGDDVLHAGDAVRLTDANPVALVEIDAGELVVWEMQTSAT